MCIIRRCFAMPFGSVTVDVEEQNDALGTHLMTHNNNILKQLSFGRIIIITDVNLT